MKLVMLLYVFAWKGNDIEFNIIEFEGYRSYKVNKNHGNVKT